MAEQNVDALYDEAQRRYLEGDFQGARAGWEAAHALAPSDVEIQKKIVQACFALGDAEAGERALAALHEGWRQSAVPEVRAWKEVVIDQLQVAGHRVWAYEALLPPTGDLSYVLTWRVLDPQGRVLMTVQLESSAYGREVGVPYVLGINTARGHATVGPMFASRPPYLVLRELAVRQIHSWAESAR